MKLQDIYEASVGKSPTLKVIKDKQKVIEYIKANCSDMLPNIKSGKIYWRGDYDFEDKLESGGAGLIVDPSKTVRQSANTTNQYTEILDHHPEMKDWPKRSRSYICSTDILASQNFADNPCVIIPLNGVKIGFTNHEDIWHTEIKLFGKETTFDSVGSVFNETGVDDWKDLLKLDADLKANKQSALDRITGQEPDLLKYKNNFLETVLAAFSPKKLGFKLGKSGDWKSEQEIWIGGPCIVISEDFYEEIHASLNGTKALTKKEKESPLYSARNAYYYARDVIKGRYEEAEALLAKDPQYAEWYASAVLKGPFKLGEPAIATSPEYASSYAMYVIKVPFKLGEPAIKKDKKYWEKYQAFLETLK